MRLIVVVGARPNVVKVGPVIPALERAGILADVAFTGSRAIAHPEDARGATSFFGVEMPSPRWFLDIGIGTEAVKTGRAMIAFEELFARERPDAVLVVGDVNPTLAAALSASKAGLPVVHLEAGLRCGDLRVPEEVNRVLISRVAALHLAPTERALENLEDEGVEPERIHFVGNVLAESVVRHLDDIRTDCVSLDYDLEPARYILGSFHRPENLSSRGRLAALLEGLGRSALPVVLPDAGAFGAAAARYSLHIPDAVRMVDSLEYRSMLCLVRDAAAVVTDSSGIQEESCVIGTPCLTVRDCTEQSATVEVGANHLLAANAGAIADALTAAIAAHASWVTPKRWDRAVSERVVRALKRGIEPLI